jgi:hypothetical protein
VLCDAGASRSIGCGFVAAGASGSTGRGRLVKRGALVHAARFATQIASSASLVAELGESLGLMGCETGKERALHTRRGPIPG